MCSAYDIQLAAMTCPAIESAFYTVILSHFIVIQLDWPLALLPLFKILG